MEPLDDGRIRAAERERDDGHALLGEQRQLLLVAVVIVARLAGLDAIPLGLLLHSGGVPLDGGAVAGRRRRGEHVDPERHVGQRAQLPDVVADGVGGLVAGRQEPEPSGLADGGGQLGGRGAAGERRLDDRFRELVEVHGALWSFGLIAPKISMNARRGPLAPRYRDAARHTDAASSPATATGRIHHAATLVPATSAVTPIATTTPSGDPPVVADDEVPQEPQERLDPAHARTASPRTASGAAAQPGPPAQHRHEPERERQRQRDDRQQRRVAARPVRAGALRAPEHPERGQHHPDPELQRVLGHAGERRVDGDAGDDHDQHGDAGGDRREPDVVLVGAEREHDEHDLEPLEQHALERDRERIGVKAGSHLAQRRGPPSPPRDSSRARRGAP